MTSRMIYVACLAAYNNGILHGRWIDVTAATVAGVQDEVQAMLKASPIAGAEEFAIHDHEGFGKLIGEYTDIETVVMIADALNDDAAGFRWLVEDRGYDVAEAARRADEVSWTDQSPADYAEVLFAEAHGEQLEALPSALSSAIDWERIARDMLLGGDIDTFEDADLGRLVITNASEF